MRSVCLTMHCCVNKRVLMASCKGAWGRKCRKTRKKGCRELTVEQKKTKSETLKNGYRANHSGDTQLCSRDCTKTMNNVILLCPNIDLYIRY